MDKKITWKEMSIAASIKLGNGSVASGFVVKKEETFFLILPKHAIYQDEKLFAKTAEFSQPTGDLRSNQFNTLSIDFEKCEIKSDSSLDFCIIKVAGKNNVTNKTKFGAGVEMISRVGISPAIKIENRIKLNQIEVASEVFIIGYPTSIGLKQSPQFDYNQPLLRKGTVSNIHMLKQTIILDASVFGGYSGSPVLSVSLIDKVPSICIIGMVIQSIPFVKVWQNIRDKIINEEYHNSNFSVAISFDPIFDLINTMES